MEYPEGATPLDPDELGGLKFRHITTRGELDELEQSNIQSGLLWISRQKKIDILSEEFAIKLHEQLFGEVWEWAGTFRRTGKNIGVDPIYIGVELRKLIDDARYWREHSSYKPSEAAIRFHHRIVFIHPFPNGNGRHARIMADHLLEKVYELPPIDWAAGYDLQHAGERRTQYIHALKAADRGDLDPLLKFIGHRPDLA